MENVWDAFCMYYYTVLMYKCSLLLCHIIWTSVERYKNFIRLERVKGAVEDGQEIGKYEVESSPECASNTTKE